jgi:hypothetical protein
MEIKKLIMHMGFAFVGSSSSSRKKREEISYCLNDLSQRHHSGMRERVRYEEKLLL